MVLNRHGFPDHRSKAHDPVPNSIVMTLSVSVRKNNMSCSGHLASRAHRLTSQVRQVEVSDHDVVSVRAKQHLPDTREKVVLMTESPLC